MKTNHVNRVTLAVALCFVMSVTGIANAEKGGNGKGKGSGDPGDGSSGGITPAIITFADSAGDRIRSDDGTAYVDGVDNVEAFLGSKANYGNVWLRVGDSVRALTLDFSDCQPGTTCNPPLVSIPHDRVSIKVDANNVQSDGLFGMAEGATIHAPMRIYYEYFANDPEGPGFVEFNPNLKGKSPCKNKSLYVVVTRVDATSWDVSGDETPLACATLPDDSLSGQYLMPFHFTVTVK